MAGPLQGIRVLDLSRVLAGPWASQLLADFGADVIKVERPVAGDETRKWGPPWLRDAEGNETGESAYFLATNRNKRSITLNLAHPDGQSVARDLAARSDVVLENFRVGRLARFGLDYESLRELNAALIYCSVTAYGQEGSKSGEPGYDAMIQGAAGLMSLTGEPASRGGSPQKTGVAVSDIMTGMYAASAILAAIVERGSSEVGQYIDLSLYDCQVAWLANQNMNYLVGGSVPRRLGNAHPNIVPYQSFQTSDGYLMLAVGNDSQFAACMACLGLTEFIDDARFRNNSLRVANRDALVAAMQVPFMKKATAEWIDHLSAQQVPAGPVNDLESIFDGAYAVERPLVQNLSHPLAGSVPTVANPVRFSRSTIEYRAAPPTLGQHTLQVLREDLGYSDEKIRALVDSGTV